MTSADINLLCLEDSSLDFDLICMRLRKDGLQINPVRVESEDEYTKYICQHPPDIILSDYQVPGFDGLHALTIAHNLAPDIPFIFVSGTLGEDVAIESLRHGAVDYITKQKLDRLASAVRRALDESAQRKARFHAEAELQQSEVRWRTLTEAMPQLVWSTRGSDGWCTYLSTQWANFSGEPVETLSGFGWLKLVHPQDSERVKTAWLSAVAGKSEYNIEYRIRRHDGQYRWFKARGVPVRDSEGAITVWYGTCTDIHDLKEAESRAEAANRAKSEFLANMSHEIRTPMNAVLGLSNILAMSGGLSPKQQEMVSTLRLSAQSLLALINDLLDISKIETNKIELEHIPFTFDSMVSEVFELLRLKASEKNIALNYTASPLGGRRFLGDPMRIRQVLINLVSNGIKFTEKGSVTVRLGEDAPGDDGRCHVRLHVQDTGIGIPPDKQDLIFDKFTQADSTTTRKYGGTGLGLAISKNLAEIMHGRISVASAPGKGAKFTLHLPLEPYTSDTPAFQQPLASPVPDGHDHGHILLVEDYDPNVMVATNMLENLGYRCDIARNGRQALGMLQQDRAKYAAILMDVQMPDMDGLEATRRIRGEEQQQGLSPITIIGVTAHALQGDRERCLQVGMNHYLAKPFQLEQLRAVLRHMQAQEA